MATATAAAAATSRVLLFTPSRTFFLLRPSRTFLIKALSTATTVDSSPSTTAVRHSILLDRLRSRHLKSTPVPPLQKNNNNSPPNAAAVEENKKRFEELGIGEEVMAAVKEMGIEVPTEIQRIGIPAVFEGKSVVLGSHTGSGKTLAYLLPLVQLMRQDEEMYGILMKPRRPRAVVLCPTRELSEQVFRVSKTISHHARFRSTMISGGGRLRPQEDSLNGPVDMVVGTPGRVLQHIKDGNIVYGDIKYLVLDEADTMFDRGFGPDIHKFLGPLKKRAEKSGDQGFQTVLVTATMTKAVQKLVNEEFQGIIHLRTSSLHKKVASARHDFIKITGTENKLESLLQVLEPSLSKGNRVMVFCNTLDSSRAVDHFLCENQIFTVNYHGEVPAEERVENLKKFKSEEGDCPTLVCTDLAARGLDLDVDHVIMFDFPRNSIDYLHRTGRTARMGAKGKVTSLVAKKDVLLATRIEEAMQKNESLESLNVDNVRMEAIKSRQPQQKGKDSKIIKANNKYSSMTSRPPKGGRRADQSPTRKPLARDRKPATDRTGRSSAPGKTRKTVTLSRPIKSSASSGKKDSFKGRKSAAARTPASKLNVVGFRGRSSSGKKESLRTG